MTKINKEKVLKAGKIASEVKAFAKTIIKKDASLLEIAEKIESKIEELGGKPAFPTNLSINDIAAHYTPSHNDENVAHGLIKIDLGVHIDGWAADTAFSLDLENSEENKKLIQAAEEALANATKDLKSSTTLAEIGKKVQTAIESYGFSPIINLSGHSIDKYELHSGITIPNIDNGQQTPVGLGIRAIEPFATSGGGKVYDGRSSGIYIVTDSKNPRSPIAREILEYALEEYETLPFCTRWLVKEFGTKAIIGLRQLETNGNIHQFEQLIEISHKPVAQAENTLLIEKNETIVTTK
jgi:methionyl aminopeptidase